MRTLKRKVTFPWLGITLLILLFSIVLISLTGFMYFRWMQTPINTNNSQPQAFVVPLGSSVDAIGRKLETENLIRNRLVFKIVVKQLNLGPKLQAGNFTLNQAMSLPEIARALTKAIPDQISVTFKEGWRKEEYADHLRQTFLSAGLDFDPEVFLNQPEVEEGYLFPDTYFFSLTASEADVARKLVETFSQKVGPLQPQVESSEYTLNQILTMASIIEREARSDRQLVSGILWQRLAIDMPLQVDATLQYIKAPQGENWWPTPLAVDKELDSPYNTYRYPGLPPAPIANPSLDSIEAAINPRSTDYLYYISEPDGTMHYAQTYQQHIENINRYLR